MACSPVPVFQRLLAASAAFLSLASLAAGTAGCRTPSVPPSLDALAQTYVKLVLATGVHEKDYIDMYDGPPEWQREAEHRRMPLAQIQQAAANLLDDLRRTPAAAEEPGIKSRRIALDLRVSSLVHHLQTLSGRRFTFDEESRQLYGMTAPVVDEASLAPLVAELDRRLPGTGPIAARLESFSRSLSVPADRVPMVVAAALDACRIRTAAHLPLPDKEHLDLVYVRDRPWSAYARYQGNLTTRIEVNVDLAQRPDQFLDLMCHEGYPGHHTQYILLETRFVRGRGWPEYQVQPLFSPASALSEGTATNAADIAFSPVERRAFEREHLFPLAGLPPSKVDLVEDVRHLTDRLSVAGTEAARRYLDGRMSRADTVMWLERYGAMPRPLELLSFVDRFRSYVIGYTRGTSLVREYVERDHDGGNAEARWRRFEEVIFDPAGAGWLHGMSIQ
jgi:hypothetical protein